MLREREPLYLIELGLLWSTYLATVLFDINTKTSQLMKLGSNITDLAWGRDDDSIFYGTIKPSSTGKLPSTHLEIIMHDLKTGVESVALVTKSGNGFDISHDGKSVAYTDNIVVNPECSDYFGTHPCYENRLVVEPFNPENSLTVSDPNNSRVILQSEDGIGYPRWIQDDASIIVTIHPRSLEWRLTCEILISMYPVQCTAFMFFL